MTRENILIAVYGIFQVSLKHEGFLEQENAKPLKLPKDASELDRDAMAIYLWLVEQLRDVTEKQINERKSHFNKIAKSLEKEYLLNMFLLSLFLMDKLLINESVARQTVLLPKVTRCINALSLGIRATQGDNGDRIVLDSSIGASNIWRLFHGEPELTKTMREYRRNKWRSK